MNKPIPITDIYQSTTIETLSGLRQSQRGKLIKIEDLISDEKNAIIFGRPGAGKTILTHWIYFKLISNKEFIPLLYPLRWQNGVSELAEFIDKMSSPVIKRLVNRRRVILLVDGYDEISLEERKKVSSALRHFISLEVGNFYLTCRAFYDILDDLPGPRYQVGEFSLQDSENYIRVFSRAYGTRINATKLVEELKDHGFNSFLSHPLMLALICILKSGSMPSLPQTTIGLIKRAIDFLTFRWDEAKFVNR